MEITIIAIRLRNFKGTRSAEYVFSGRNACLEGPNGCGKSTVFDAFTWLLFGKDHRDQTANTFEVKTINPDTGQPYPREDHWVEAVLRVDGTDHVLRRAWVENWVKPTGAVEDVLKGHTSAFFVDGVDVGTKAAYDAVVAGWLHEDSFKLLTNPHYFIDDAFTGWKERRKALLALVADDPGRARVREEFADVVDKLSGRSIEDYRKRLDLEKRANKKDLAQVLSRIDGMREALPPDQDTNAVTNRINEQKARRDKAIAELKAQAAALDKSIASADAADEARKAENTAIWAEITQLQLKMGNYTTEATKAALAQNTARQQAIIAARANLDTAKAKMAAETAQQGRTAQELAKMENDRAVMAHNLAKMGEKYKTEKARAFQFVADTRCPYCGQEIPAATQEQARAEAQAHFLAEQRKAVDTILADARALKVTIGELDARIAGMRDIIDKSRQLYGEAQAKAQEWTAEVQRLEGTPAADLAAIEAQAVASEDYRAMQRQEQELRSKALKTGRRPDELDELVRQRKDIDQKIEAEMDRCAKAELDAQEALSVGKVRAEQLALIRQKEQEAKNFADAIAREEREEARAAEFMKADIDSVEAAINGMFHTARWKMYDTTIDGNLVEMCDVTTPDGVPYKSMNDAMKILCGMDCIRVFSERYGTTAPIFIDNAESITQHVFDTPAQVIRLVVKDTDKLTLITE
jgi:uncharacterized protein with PIN domain